MPLLKTIRKDKRLTANLAFACFWIALGPVAFWLGWLKSVTFVSILSLAALAVTNLAAWLAELKLMKEE
jgi:hypothetical protein